MSLSSRLAKLAATPPREWATLVRDRLAGRRALADFDAAHPCVFVLSTGRVGTQTLAALCGLSENVRAHHEPEPRLFALGKLAHAAGSSAASDGTLLEGFRLARAALLEEARSSGRGYVETSPQVTFLARVIRELVPDARLIHVVRDPRDVVRSGMRRGWYAGARGDESRIVPGPDDPHAASWEAMSPFEKNLWLWAETNRFILELASGLPGPAPVLIHSEQLTAGEPPALERLYDTLGADVPRRAQIEAVLAQRMNAQTRGSFPPWDAWTPDQREATRRIAGPVAERLGYALD